MEVMFPIPVPTQTPALFYQMTTQSISSQRKLSIRGKVKEDSQYAESKSLKVIYHYGHFENGNG